MRGSLDSCLDRHGTVTAPGLRRPPQQGCSQLLQGSAEARAPEGAPTRPYTSTTVVHWPTACCCRAREAKPAVVGAKGPKVEATRTNWALPANQEILQQAIGDWLGKAGEWSRGTTRCASLLLSAGYRRARPPTTPPATLETAMWLARVQAGRHCPLRSLSTVYPDICQSTVCPDQIGRIYNQIVVTSWTNWLDQLTYNDHTCTSRCECKIFESKCT